MITSKTITSARPETARQPGLPAFLATAGILLPAAALGVGFFAMTRAHVSAIGPYGLIQALPPLYYVSLALAVLGFLLTWNSSRAHPLRFCIDLVVLVFLLQSPPAIIEPEARFPVAWLTAGFTDFVSQTGHVLPGIDARFSWPGFFAGIGMVARAGGLPTTITLLKWWPVAMNLLYLPPFYLISRSILRDHRRAMLATWLFPFANWVGQDYFSPQSVAFLLYLVVVWLVIDQFGARRRRLLPRRSSREDPWAQDPELDAPRSSLPLGVGLAVLSVLAMAVIVSHQITPVFAALVVLFLAFFGRTRLKTFGALIVLGAAAWLCFAAITFWAGHFNMIFGGLGNLGGNVNASLASRLQGSQQHHQIVDVRLIISVVTWALAALGLVAGYRRRQEVRTPAILMVTPLLVLSGGGYGGEAGLRVYLFSLAGALPLAAMLLPVVRSGWGSVRSSVAVALVAAVFVPGFVLARWGNELSEMARPNEITAIRTLYRIAPAGVNLVSITPEVPWKFADISRYHYETSNWDIFFTDDIPAIAGQANHDRRGGYVLITTGELILGEQTYGQPTDWGTRLEQSMLKSGKFALVYSNPDAKIFKFEKPRSFHG